MASPTETQSGHATLSHEGGSLEMPVIRGSEGETAVDISQLRAKTGMITLDPGYGNTGACRSAITFIDGEKGILRYRGYPIEELAEKSTFLEVAYLLIQGELPNPSERRQWVDAITHHTLLHENIKKLIDGFHHDAHPMGIL